MMIAVFFLQPIAEGNCAAFFLSIEAGQWTLNVIWTLTATTVFIIDKTPNKYLKTHCGLGLLKKVNRKV